MQSYKEGSNSYKYPLSKAEIISSSGTYIFYITHYHILLEVLLNGRVNIAIMLLDVLKALACSWLNKGNLNKNLSDFPKGKKFFSWGIYQKS